MKKKTQAVIAQQPEDNEQHEIAQVIPIRTETVLSQYPIHRLSKGSEPLEVCITTSNERGKVTTVWEVTANRKYGEPGILAYKLDTLFINRLIDEITIRDIIEASIAADFCSSCIHNEWRVLRKVHSL